MHGQPRQPHTGSSSSLSSPPRPPTPPRPYARGARPLLWAAFALCLAAGAVIGAVELGWGPLHGADTGAARALHAYGLAHRTWTHTNLVLSEAVWAPWTMRALLALALVRLWLRGQRLLAGWCAGACLAEAALQQGLKAVIDRPRPHWRHPLHLAHYTAMPSGHAMTAALVCVLLLWLLWRTGPGVRLWSGALAVGAVSVAGVSFTRVALGVHWVSDTVAGALLGCALGALAAGLWQYRGPVPPGPPESTDGRDGPAAADGPATGEGPAAEGGRDPEGKDPA